MMHLLWCVTVAVDHTVGGDDDKGVGPVKGKIKQKTQKLYGCDANLKD